MSEADKVEGEEADIYVSGRPPFLSVIVVACNELPHLWYTLRNLTLQLPGDTELIVVNSGSTDRTAAYLESVQMAQPPGPDVLVTEAISPSHAREQGAAEARGKYLLFLDGHVLFDQEFWQEEGWLGALYVSPPENLGILHFCQGGNGWHEDSLTHYHLTLRENFWGTGACNRAIFNGPTEFSSEKMFAEIASHGQGCFLVPRKLFMSIGGYGLPFRGYAGEETFLDLRLAMLGYKVYVANASYYHCTERQQNYVWTNEQVFANQVMGAYVLGGSEWSESVRKAQLSKHIGAGYHGAYNLLYDGILASQTVQWARNGSLSERKFTLEQVLEDYERRNIPH
jgi:GT2 family glycosyltransferase